MCVLGVSWLWIAQPFRQEFLADKLLHQGYENCPLHSIAQTSQKTWDTGTKVTDLHPKVRGSETDQDQSLNDQICLTDRGESVRKR